jgi:Rhodanese-like domain
MEDGVSASRQRAEPGGNPPGLPPTSRLTFLRAEDVRQLIATRRSPVLIDVRSVLPYQDGHLPGARSIPDAEFAGRLTEVPREGPVVILHWGALKNPVER